MFNNTIYKFSLRLYAKGRNRLLNIYQYINIQISINL